MPTGLGVEIAIIRAGRVLLTKREDFEVWCLPGGGVDSGESVAQAAVREALEETGLEVELTRLVGIYSWPKWRAGGMHIVLFTARPVGGTLRLAANETVDVGYFDPHRLPDPLRLGQRRLIVDATNADASGVAWSQDVFWPFPDDMTRDKLYATRDRSGLSRQQFYLRYFGQLGAEDERLEVGGARPGDASSG